MNILVIGSGGREHAICWKLRMGPSARKIYCAPGNGGTSKSAANVDIPVQEHSEVIKFCEKSGIDLVVVGPEAPLARGISDDLEDAGIKVFGPSRAASRLESDKIFAKELMSKHGIPTADFRVFDNYGKAEKYIKSKGLPLVVKAYGLAAGKGVIVAVSREEALSAAQNMLVKKKFGQAGERIIIEDYLDGEEASILVLTDGENVIPLASSQDHKRVFDGDKGPNTGGMGAYSPAPVITEELFKKVSNEIIYPTIKALGREGIKYKGVLYYGIMITKTGPRVLEYNARFGDPETQVILPRLKSDLAELLMATAGGDISGKVLEWDRRDCACVVLAEEGYPGEYEKHKEITGLNEAEKDGALIFHAGTIEKNGKYVTSGGRVLNVVGMAEGIENAVAVAYKAISKIQFEGMHYRKDIGYRAVKRGA